MTLTVSINHRFQSFHLDASFVSERGVTALFGRSGSGKTSMIRIIAGLTKPDNGKVVLDDTTLADSDRRLFVPGYKRRFGYVFQEARLFPHMTVQQNLDYGRWFTPKANRQTNDARIIEMLGIGALLSRHPDKLSGGEKQRVAIGRALLSSPRMLLMDEPLAALDEARKLEILPYLELLRDEMRLPIVYVSHSVAEVARLADKVIVMKDGKVEAAGPANEVLGESAFSNQLERREMGSILSGKIEAVDDKYGLLTVRLKQKSLTIPAKAGEIGKTVRVHIPARDVMLATENPNGLSALNILQGTVKDISDVTDGMVTVSVNCGVDTILSRITALSQERLGLEPGKPVFAIVKSAALDRY